MSLNLSAWALRNQSLIRFLIIILFLGGYFSYTKLSQKEDPDFTLRTMIVTAYWPGATAEQIQLQIVERLEKKLQEVPGLDVMEGYARSGEAVLYVNLLETYPSKLVPDSWYQVRKKVNDIKQDFPSEMVGPFFNDEYGDVFGSIFAVTGDGYSYAQLKSYVDDIRLDLLQVKGVNKVNIIGDQPEKIYIEFSYNKIATLKIDPQTIINTVKDQNSLLPSGVIRTNSDEVVIRTIANFHSLDGIRNINIQTTNGNFRLGDIATVYRGYEDPPTFKLHYQGREAIGLAISMVSTGDIIALGQSLEEKIKSIQMTLPIGVDIHQVSNQPEVVHIAVSEFMHSLIEAVLIVLLISFFSLGLRSGSVVALSIPLVLALSFLVMYALNIDLQRVSLGALIIAIGLLVDDAMISVEMMLRKIDEGFDKMYAVTFAYTSTAFPMLTGTLITIAGFAPIGMAKSDVGEYTSSIFSVVAISLLVSWIVAVIFAPYFGYILLKEKPKSEEEQERVSHTSYIHDLIENCVIHKRLVIIITLIAFILSILGFKLVEKQFFPASNRPEILVNLQLPEGTPFSETERNVNKLEKYLSVDKNIVNYTSYIGGSAVRFYLPLKLEENAINFAQIVIMSKGGKVREEEIKKLNLYLAEQFPDVIARVSRLENGPPVGYPIQFRVSGNDIEKLRDITNQIEAILRKNSSIINVNNDWGQTLNEQLIIDTDKSRALGITDQNLMNNLETVLNQYTITQYREANNLIDIQLRSIAKERVNLALLKNINIYVNNGNVYTDKGQYVPLDQIAYFVHGTEEGIIHRRNGLPTITIRADVEDPNQALDIATGINKTVTSKVRSQLLPGYTVQLAGVADSSSSAQDSILDVLPFSLAIMLIILMLQLHSFQRVIIVFLTAPLGLIGVTLTLLIFHLPFGFVAMLGVISLSGMIMRNSVILIDQIEKNIAADIKPRDAIIKATSERFRPIMLTAAAAILAMIPLLNNVFWGPMAASIMGGLFVATALTILFLPALYAWWFKI